ncbi:MAG: hypothetical protein FWD78_01350 [Treponema sp.]|nr:hypothetical protein [Treponema sp.]
MKLIIIGLIVIAAAIIACIPGGLGWWDEVLHFLRGGLPVAAIFLGLAAVFFGIKDIKKKLAGKKPAEKKPVTK